jgi:hypothetical protein
MQAAESAQPPDPNSIPYAMSTEAEGKAAYEAARKDLTNSLTKRKDIDKQLVSFYSVFLLVFH